MTNLNIAFCDDDPIIRDHIQKTVTGLFQRAGIELRAMEFGSPQELFTAMGHMTFGLLFLDIDMPGMDGIDLGRQLRKLGSNADIIFVSNLNERVYEVFDVHPWSFVRKSTFDAEIPGVIAAYVAALQNRVSQVVLHDIDGKTRVIQPDNVIYIESAGKVQKLYMALVQQPFFIRSSLQELEQLLSPMGFIRIHKGFLVNYRYVQKITSREVTLDSGDVLPMGRDRLQQAREQYLSLMKWKSSHTPIV